MAYSAGPGRQGSVNDPLYDGRLKENRAAGRSKVTAPGNQPGNPKQSRHDGRGENPRPGSEDLKTRERLPNDRD